MNTYKKPEVSEEHLKIMAEHYGTIGEMTRSDFDTKIELDLGILSKENKLHSGILLDIGDNDLEKLFKKRNSDIDCVSVGKKGLIMNIEFPKIFFKTSDGKDIEHLEKYLAQNNISQDEFKELVSNALYINLKTPFCVNELPGIITDKTKELANGVLETKPDKIESVEELKEKKNREIFKNVLRRKGYSDEVIDDIDKVSIFLNNDGLNFLKKHGNQSAAAFTELYPRNIALSLEDFLKIFDLREVSDYFIRPLKFGKDIYINVVDFPVGEEEIRELTSEASSTTNPDKIESVEELREKENREIILGLLKNNYGEFINEIDYVTFILNEEGKTFFRESSDPKLVSLASPNNSGLEFKTFLQKIDLNKIYAYTDSIILVSLFPFKNKKIKIDEVDFFNNKSNQPS